MSRTRRVGDGPGVQPGQPVARLRQHRDRPDGQPPDNSPNPDPGSAVRSQRTCSSATCPAGTTTLLSVTTDGRLAAGRRAWALGLQPRRPLSGVRQHATNLTANAPDHASGGCGRCLPARRAHPTSSSATSTTGTTTLVSATPGGLQSDGVRCRAGLQSRWQLAGLHQQRHRSDAATRWTPISRRAHDDYRQHAVQHNVTPPTQSSTATPTATIGPLLPSGLLADIPTVHGLPDPSVQFNVFLTDLTTGTTTLISVTPAVSSRTAMATDIRLQPRWALPGLHQQRRRLDEQPLRRPRLPPHPRRWLARVSRAAAVTRSRPLIDRPTSSSATCRRARPRSPRRPPAACCPSAMQRRPDLQPRQRVAVLHEQRD